MKVFTPALFLLVVFCVGFSEGIKCFNRKEKIHIQSLMKEMKCDSPQPTMVELPVPEGYDYVVPSMEKVKRCNQNVCLGRDRSCQPMETRMIKMKVEAKKMDGSNMSCMSIPVEEHLECSCQCVTKKEHCESNQDYDGTSCMCKCQEDVRNNCDTEDGSYMFRESDCQCVPTQS